jgi:hypothetical protein
MELEPLQKNSEYAKFFLLCRALKNFHKRGDRLEVTYEFVELETDARINQAFDILFEEMTKTQKSG